MARRSVTFTFRNSEGLERKRTIYQDVPDYVSPPPPPPPPIEDPQPLPSPEDIFIDNPIQLPIEPIDLSDLEIDFSNIDFGLGGLGEMSIGPIFAPGGGQGFSQGWNNGDPSNNWGLGAKSVGGIVPINKNSVPRLSSGKAVIPPAPPKPVTPNNIRKPGLGSGVGSGRGSGSGQGR